VARGGDTELIKVAVIDEGIGIDEADLDHVFDPFFRSDRSRSRATGGAGLGLALAKRIVDLHEGKIWLRSEPDVGTQVVFALRASLLRCHQRTAEGLSPAAPRPRSP
jgi:signal transduction histidine kinase